MSSPIQFNPGTTPFPNLTLNRVSKPAEQAKKTREAPPKNSGRLNSVNQVQSHAQDSLKGHLSFPDLGQSKVKAVSRTKGGESESMGTHIRSDYTDTVLMKTDAPLTPRKTKAERLVLLDGIAQRDNSDDTMTDDVRCGPSCIVAGVFYAEGTEGLEKLKLAMTEFAADKEVGLNVEVMFEEINLKNPTKGDIAKIQEGLFEIMAGYQIDKGWGEAYEDGIDIRILKEFLSTSNTPDGPYMDNQDGDLKAIFQAHNLDIALVDTDGKEGGNHFVMSINGETVYDPYPIDGGKVLNQVSTDKATFKAYQSAVTYFIDDQSL